jgi:hypothetical protein
MFVEQSPLVVFIPSKIFDFHLFDIVFSDTQIISVLLALLCVS